MVNAYLAFLVLLALQRIGELVISRRHTRWALARGGVEFGERHFRIMAALHVAFFLGCAGEVVRLSRPFDPLLGYPMLAIALLAQIVRAASMRALGPYWNARVIVVPGAPVVTRGPYRFVRHPNYAAVVLEGFAVPLIHGAWLTASAFSLLNAILLSVRIRCEERALAAHSDYARRLGSRARFLPRLGVRRQRAAPAAPVSSEGS
ncbi:MAG: isoprenylcysteine carboxyl methyltransferase family protein [Deltaproteobacteria bacterium]|nr:MAG: isoprenylcysteine carboxyl methyltransferase family protein [Deltaproteobacteria bacterium]